MFDAMCGIACFVTVTVSMLYGTRISWLCGKKCAFKESPAIKRQALYESVPAAMAVYFFGFVVLFSYLMNGAMVVFVFSITSAMILATLVVAMAMPELRRKPHKK
jgi:hypothetical protein